MLRQRSRRRYQIDRPSVDHEGFPTLLPATCRSPTQRGPEGTFPPPSSGRPRSHLRKPVRIPASLCRKPWLVQDPQRTEPGGQFHQLRHSWSTSIDRIHRQSTTAGESKVVRGTPLLRVDSVSSRSWGVSESEATPAIESSSRHGDGDNQAHERRSEGERLKVSLALR